MDRSPGFGSIIYDFIRPFQTRFLFGSIAYTQLNLAIYNNSLDRSTKSTISPFKWLYLLVNIGFQVLFHSPPGVLFTFPSRYSSLSVTKQYLALRDGPRSFIRDFSCLALLWILLTFTFLSYTGLSPSMVCFPKHFYQNCKQFIVVRTPLVFLLMVWALPISLATTLGIIFYFLFLWVLRCFSSPRSLLTYYFTHMQILELFFSSEFPHSDIYALSDICSYTQLFAAYHVLLRLLVPRHSPYALCSLT